ncbi:hypothetical protein EVG20_g7364 [Dentipellis fragilis]|uniref:UNC-45/Cro1/She4 central domain-containing protein n=1 Tax=Dentipellis fragilis TaxID=205917 RepID=A0A4Y9YFG9_9AGAM|nr:hypothetical protein EVG20_g7364 [Dentipellis fragilis]
MTISTINVATLKKVKNSVIGNPSAKLALAQDELFIATLVNCLNDLMLDEGASGSQDSIRIEAAQVISSLSYGSPDALQSLLCANAPQAFLYAISRFTSSEPPAVKFAFARALRALATATAEHVGPSQWGLKDDVGPVHEEAKAALDYFFQDPLDVYLPLLADASPQTSTAIAQLLGSALRAPDHRAAVAAWVPPSERNRTPRRGWEKGDVGQGGWVARQLTGLARSKDVKVQEAALWALAALAKDNHDVAMVLSKPSIDNRTGTESPSALSLALMLCKSRTTPVQLAGALCATHILRAQTASSHGLHPHLHHPHAGLNHTGPSPGLDMAAALTVVHVMNRLIASSAETPQARAQACFVLQHLVMDEKELCQTAFESAVSANCPTSSGQ